MKISIGSDHRGIDVRRTLKSFLESFNLEVIDCGFNGEGSCDYPDIASLVAGKVAAGECDRGILICGTGIGMAIAANKFQNIRAAVCGDSVSAEMSRRHNNSNVLCLSADLMRQQSLNDMIQTWLETEFEGGRHQRRIDKIGELFRSQCAID